MKRISKRISNIITVAFIGFLTLFGLVLLFWGAWDTYLAVSSRNWPTVQGELTRLSASTSLGIRGVPVVALDLEYRYQVEDAVFRSNRINYGNRFDGSAKRSLANRYDAGDEINVYYDPEDPSRSVLVSSGGLMDYLFPSVGGALLVFILVLYWKNRKLFRNMFKD